MCAILDRSMDPGIPTLPAVLDPLELGEHLRQSLPWQGKGLREVEVRLVKHHAGKRCVLEVTGRTEDGSLSLFGKVYAEDCSDVYRLMEEIGRAGFGPQEEFSIPQAVTYLPALQLLLQENVEGRPATESFLSGDEAERAATAGRCARWLARFHAIAPRIGPSFPLSSHLLSIEKWFRRLATLGEPLADKARELFKRLGAAAPDPQRIEMRTIHGDYSHHQVILSPGRTVVVDWDKYRLADPNQDVARFTVGLQRLGQRCLGSIRALDAAAEGFLKTYVASNPSRVTTHLAFQKAATWLEHAKHDVHKQAPGWRDKAEAALDEGLRVLEQGV